METSTYTSVTYNPFLYSNQCKDAVYAYNIPIVILSAIISTALVPSCAVAFVNIPFLRDRFAYLGSLFVDPILWLEEGPSYQFPSKVHVIIEMPILLVTILQAIILVILVVILVVVILILVILLL